MLVASIRIRRREDGEIEAVELYGHGEQEAVKIGLLPMKVTEADGAEHRLVSGGAPVRVYTPAERRALYAWASECRAVIEHLPSLPDIGD